MSEQIQILRRIAERGLRLSQDAQRRGGDFLDIDTSPAHAWVSAHEQHIDLWQHMLDEIGRLPTGDSER